MTRRIELKGRRFGRLLVKKWKPGSGANHGGWLCVCDCGNTVIEQSTDLVRGKVNSCGCLRREVTGNNRRTHGECKTRLYRTWSGMKQRCTNPKRKSYRDYGARGIKVCPEWSNSFQQFEMWAKSSGYSDTLTIDRINPDGNYEPSNCRWVNKTQQARNVRNNIKITINRSTRLLVEWCEIFGAEYDTVYGRIRWGWDPVSALTEEKSKK